MPGRICTAALLALLLVSGCTSTRQLDEMQLQINVLEQQNRAIEESLLAQDSLSRSLLEALQVFKARTEFADKAGDARLDEISARLNDVLDRIERVQQSVAGLQQGLLSASAESIRDSASDTAAAGFTYIDAKRLFDRAFKDMASGDYSLAILGFKEYVKTFPETHLTDDAQFWIGECHYRQQDYATAAAEYARVEESYADSDKMASALYKLGRCHGELGETARAREYFEQTVARFPNTQEAELASEKLKDSEE
jgi:tol-pal system protein YbgF